MWHQPVSKTNVQTLFSLLHRSFFVSPHNAPRPHPRLNRGHKHFIFKNTLEYICFNNWAISHTLTGWELWSVSVYTKQMTRWWRKVFLSLSSALFCNKRRQEKTIKMRSKCSELCSKTIRLRLMVSLKFSTFWRPLSNVLRENCCLLILLNSKVDSINFLVQQGCDAGITFYFKSSQACRRNTSTHTRPIGTLRRGGAR